MLPGAHALIDWAVDSRYIHGKRAVHRATEAEETPLLRAMRRL